MAKRITFEGRCQRCEGTGLWQRRAGYTCRGCGGTGRVTVVAKPRPFPGREDFGVTYSFYVVSAKGNVTKERYRAKARLTHELRQFDVGSTVGGGWYEFERKALPVGTEVEVLGVVNVGATSEHVRSAGELHIGVRGGSGTTGRRTTPNGHEVITEVEVTEEAAAKVIEQLLAA
jgi:hypothetical protein